MELKQFILALDSIIKGNDVEKLEVYVDSEGGCCRSELISIKQEDNKIIIEAL